MIISITGPSGSGKTVLASAIACSRYYSGRRSALDIFQAFEHACDDDDTLVFDLNWTPFLVQLVEELSKDFPLIRVVVVGQ